MGPTSANIEHMAGLACIVKPWKDRSSFMIRMIDTNIHVFALRKTA